MPPSNGEVLPNNPYAVSRIKKLHILLWTVALTAFFGIINKRELYTPPEDKSVKLKNATHVQPQKGKDQSPSLRAVSSPAPIQSPTLPPTLPPQPQQSSTLSIPTSSPYTNKLQPQPSAPTQLPPFAPVGNLSVHTSATLTDTEQAFVDEHCDFTPSAQWYPTGALAWQQRAPYFMIAGAKHSGTTTLHQALLQHPQISSAAVRKEVGFFLPMTFQTFAGSNGLQSKTRKKTKVFAARNRMYAGDYRNTKSLKEDDRLVAMDATAGYLFFSNQVPQSILCVAPWSKIVIILRDPVDRAYAHWAHGREYQGLRLSFEDWIAPELQAMQKVGLVPTPNNAEEEDRAWRAYQDVRSLPGAIGRSMYNIQLRHWMNTYRQAGKDPTKVMYIMRLEELIAHPKEEYAKLVNFLGLSQEALSTELPHALAATGKQAPINPETRQKLQEFFAPYNERLAQLLGNDFGGSWKGVWK